jgi:hypothetical protein
MQMRYLREDWDKNPNRWEVKSAEMLDTFYGAEASWMQCMGWC